MISPYPFILADWLRKMLRVPLAIAINSLNSKKLKLPRPLRGILGPLKYCTGTFVVFTCSQVPTCDTHLHSFLAVHKSPSSLWVRGRFIRAHRDELMNANPLSRRETLHGSFELSSLQNATCHELLLINCSWLSNLNQVYGLITTNSWTGVV